MASKVRIYHNPRCSKSRQTLALLEERGVEPEIVLYLQDPPSAEDVLALAKKAKRTVHELLRTKEAVYRELGLSAESAPEALAAAVAEHPILLERPVVVKGSKAALGRPPESVLEIL